MKPSFSKVGGACIASQTEGRHSVIIPATLTCYSREGEVFDYLIEKFRFNEFLEGLRNRTYEGAEDTEYSRAYLKQLKEDLEGGRIEVKISFEYTKTC